MNVNRCPPLGQPRQGFWELVPYYLSGCGKASYRPSGRCGEIQSQRPLGTTGRSADRPEGLRAFGEDHCAISILPRELKAAKWSLSGQSNWLQVHVGLDGKTGLWLSTQCLLIGNLTWHMRIDTPVDTLRLGKCHDQVLLSYQKISKGSPSIHHPPSITSPHWRSPTRPSR